MMRRAWMLIGLTAWCLCAPAPPLEAAKKRPKPPPAGSSMPLTFADALAVRPRSAAEDAMLKAWADNASLLDLMFVLRSDPRQLGSGEPVLVRAALVRCPADRPSLRNRLLLRLALCDPARARKELGTLVDLVPAMPVRPRGSVFRLAVLVPDSGGYAGYGRAVRAGLDAALVDANSATLYTLALDSFGTGEDLPARAARAADSASIACGALVGELLSVPTYAIASASRLLGVSLISPTATDEGVGDAGGSVFQIGPSGARRGEVLARQVLLSGARRVAVLVDEARARDSFGRGFAAAIEAGGGTVEWRGTYGGGDFRPTLRTLSTRKLDALFWDGDARDAAALLRGLAREQLSLALVGGESLAPEQQHNDTRVLLEGVRYVADDWRLPTGVQTRLDSLARAHGEERAGSLYVRGYLAGRLLCDAPRNGALAPEEVGDYLRGRLDSNALAAERGFLDCLALGAKLEVFTVQRGKPVLAGP